MKKLLLGLTLLIGVVAHSFGQTISLTSTAYTQNFNTLSLTPASTTNTLAISGWTLTETGGGARDNEQYATDDGSSTTGDTYSYGTAAATDRALGSLRSGTLISAYGAYFTNNSGAAITSILISYTGEQWRLGTASRADKLAFSYSLDATSLTTGTFTAVTSLDFNTPNTVTLGAKDGNQSANRTAISAIITGLNIPDGSTIFIKWDDTDATGSDDGLAIDDFSLLINPSPLPITLTSFTGKSAGTAVDLSWATSSEKDNQTFEILRSGDSKSFVKIGSVDGSGTTSTAKNYVFTDKSPLPGTNYYQLKQIDLDGKSTTAPEIVAVKSNATASNFKVIASQETNSVELTIYSAITGNSSFMIYDVSGKKLVDKSLSLTKGYNTFSLAVPASAKGVHVATLVTGTETITSKFIQ